MLPVGVKHLPKLTTPKKFLLEDVLPAGVKTILPIPDTKKPIGEWFGESPLLKAKRIAERRKKIPYILPRPIAYAAKTAFRHFPYPGKEAPPPGLIPPKQGLEQAIQTLSDTLQYGGGMSIAPSLRRPASTKTRISPTQKKKHIVSSCRVLAEETPIPPGMKLPTVAPGGTKVVSVAVPKGHKPVIVRRSRLPKRHVVRKSIAQQITRRKPGHRRVGAKYYS